MDTISKKYKVTAEVITPLSIGQGSERDWVAGIDYIDKNNSSGNRICYHLDMRKMYDAGIDVDRLSQLFIKGDAQGIANLIGNKLEQISDLQFPMPSSTTNPIKSFFRNELSGRPVLAGSSLKGAIRSILFTNLRDGNENENKSVFGSMAEGTDFMRFIRVGDFEFDKTGLYTTKIYNLHQERGTWIGGWKHSFDLTNTNYDPIGFNTIYECLMPGSKSVGYILFATQLFDLLKTEQRHSEKKSQLMHAQDACELCEIVNDHTWSYLEKELKFFDTFYQGANSDKVGDSIEELLDKIEVCAPNECILKMSAGSGFHSITGDWQFKDYTEGPLNRKDNNDLIRRGEKVNPKSRKIIVSGSKPFSLMGFIKLRFELA